MRRSCLILAASLAVAVCGPAFAGFTGTDLFLPSVGAKPGVPPSVWYTTVWVHNPNATAADLTFYLLERKANVAPKHFEDTLPAGDTRRYDNAVKTMFGVETFGAIRVTANVRVFAGARIYSQSGTLDDSVGQYFAGQPATFAIGSGQSTELTGVWQTVPSGDSTFRYNYGFVETTGSGTCQVKVTVKDETGAPIGNQTYTVQQWEQVQKAFKDEFPALSRENARLTVEVISGTGRILAFGSLVASGSQDPTTFEMAFRDELLGSSGGLTEVAHDGTLTGSGTAGSLLGLADNAVTVLKIADGAVTSAKIANGAVTSERIENGTIKAVDIAGGAITAPAIAGNAVSSTAIADGAVTQAKLSASGADYGEVLTSTGTSLVWREPSFTLPFADSDNNAGSAFWAANGAPGGETITAIQEATSGDGIAIFAEANSGSGMAIYGTNNAGSGDAVAVRAISNDSNSGIAVKAEVDGSNAVAVKGLSQASTGATYGVVGEANSASGAAVKGLFTGSGDGVGVLGMSDFSRGVGGRFQGGKGVYALSDGAGLSRVAIEASSLNGSGVSLYAHQQSSDAVIVGTNTGSGRLLKLFAGASGDNLRFVVENSGDVKADGTYSSPAADLAELLPAGEVLEPGDVLAVGGDGRLVRSTAAYQSSVVGVHSTKPAFLGGAVGEGAAEGLVPLAVLGVVPVKVTASNGAILPGDLLVASPVAGHAMRAAPLEVQGVKVYPAGVLLGKALGRFDGPGTGVVSALLNVQ